MLLCNISGGWAVRLRANEPQWQFKWLRITKYGSARLTS